MHYGIRTYLFNEKVEERTLRVITTMILATPDPGAISIQDKRSSVNGLGLVELCQVLGHLRIRFLRFRKGAWQYIPFKAMGFWTPAANNRISQMV